LDGLRRRLFVELGDWRLDCSLFERRIVLLGTTLATDRRGFGGCIGQRDVGVALLRLGLAGELGWSGGYDFYDFEVDGGARQWFG
jgi:hypothetical protein